MKPEQIDGVQESIYPMRHEVNIADGSEFLDDSIRMKDQPLSEKNVEDNDPSQQRIFLIKKN